MSTIKRGGLVVLALVALTSETVAQARPAPRQTGAQRQAAPAAADQGFWELGTDVRVGIGIDDPKTFFINVPSGILRAGYYVTNVLSLEPALTFSSAARENQTATSFWVLQIGGLYHLSPDRRQSQIYIHPSIGFSGGSGGAPNRTMLGAGAGIKKPIVGNRLVMRGEAGLNHTLRSGGAAAETDIFVTLGWSVYTR